MTQKYICNVWMATPDPVEEDSTPGQRRQHARFHQKTAFQVSSEGSMPGLIRRQHARSQQKAGHISAESTCSLHYNMRWCLGRIQGVSTQPLPLCRLSYNPNYNLSMYFTLYLFWFYIYISLWRPAEITLPAARGLMLSWALSYWWLVGWCWIEHLPTGRRWGDSG